MVMLEEISASLTTHRFNKSRSLVQLQTEGLRESEVQHHPHQAHRQTVHEAPESSHLVHPGPGYGEAVDHGYGRGEVGGHGLDVDVELPALVPALLSSHSSCVRVTCICWIRGIQAMESATSTRMNSLQ